MPNGRPWSALKDWEQEQLIDEAGAKYTQRPSDTLRRILCSRCEHGVVFMQRGDAVSAFCTLLGACGDAAGVPLDLTECSRFANRHKPDTLEQMTKAAMPIDPRPDAGGQYL